MSVAMSVMVVEGIDDGAWVGHLARALPHFEVHELGSEVDPATVTHVAMWRLAPERLAAYVGLEAVLLMGAGYDHLDLDTFPKVPIVRLVDPAMADDIALYVLSWAVHFQRDFDRFAAMQATATWRGELGPVFARDFTIGVLGAGEIGRRVLETCAGHGFSTVGWSRSNHDRPLDDFFRDADVVVDLVPLSAATRGLIGAPELAALGNGVLINVGRGATVDTAALIDALDGELRAAVLDVFETEPLPSDSPLWRHPKLIVTPHVAGRSDPVTASAVIATSIAELDAGRRPAGMISR
jgi:glyoxylate/hydroxypyruvate reductase A